MNKLIASSLVLLPAACNAFRAASPFLRPAASTPVSIPRSHQMWAPASDAFGSLPRRSHPSTFLGEGTARGVALSKSNIVDVHSNHATNDLGGRLSALLLSLSLVLLPLLASPDDAWAARRRSGGRMGGSFEGSHHPPSSRRAYNGRSYSRGHRRGYLSGYYSRPYTRSYYSRPNVVISPGFGGFGGPYYSPFGSPFSPFGSPFSPFYYRPPGVFFEFRFPLLSNP